MSQPLSLTISLTAASSRVKRTDAVSLPIPLLDRVEPANDSWPVRLKPAFIEHARLQHHCNQLTIWRNSLVLPLLTGAALVASGFLLPGAVLLLAVPLGLPVIMFAQRQARREQAAQEAIFTACGARLDGRGQLIAGPEGRVLLNRFDLPLPTLPRANPFA